MNDLFGLRWNGTYPRTHGIASIERHRLSTSVFMPSSAIRSCPNQFNLYFSRLGVPISRLWSLFMLQGPEPHVEVANTFRYWVALTIAFRNVGVTVSCQNSAHPPLTVRPRFCSHAPMQGLKDPIRMTAATIYNRPAVPINRRSYSHNLEERKWRSNSHIHSRPNGSLTPRMQFQKCEPDLSFG